MFKCLNVKMLICFCVLSFLYFPVLPVSAITGDTPKWKMPELQISIPSIKNFSTPAPCPDDASKMCIPWIGEYIVGIYKYAIGVAGILATVIIMWGGLIWLTAGGNAARVTEAKTWIGGSVTGLILVLCSYMILYEINPDLIKFKSIGVSMVDQMPIPENIKEFSEKCKATNIGECAVSKMSIFGSKDKEASAICMAESGGNPKIFNKSTKCRNSNRDYYAVWGLFQFNLSANYFYDKNNNKLNCPAAFDRTWTNSKPYCNVIDDSLYADCVMAAINGELSIINAKILKGGRGWGPWEANAKWCKF